MTHCNVPTFNFFHSPFIGKWFVLCRKLVLLAQTRKTKWEDVIWKDNYAEIYNNVKIGIDTKNEIVVAS